MLDVKANTIQNWKVRQAPRRWQDVALTRWRGAGNKGVVSVVTGGGKTVFAQMCMLDWARTVPTPVFNIIVPTNALLDQWFVSLVEDLNVTEAQIACYSGQEKPSKPKTINIFVINTARELAHKIAESTENCFLIVDECHRAGSPQNALALRGSYDAALGLSATPEREYDSGFSDVVAPVLGQVMYEYGYKEASEDGVIAEFELVNVKTDFQPDEWTQYSRLTKRAAILFQELSKDPTAEHKLKIVLRARASVANSARMRLPVAAKLAIQQSGARILIFHERVSEAETLVELLRKKNRSVTIYHSKISPVIRRDNLKLFRRGMFDILVSCRALDEGINVPEASVAIIASSTASMRQRIQRLGRVLRPSRGKEKASIYTIYITEQEQKRLEREERGLSGAGLITWMEVSAK